jgi:hypothetical protein
MTVAGVTSRNAMPIRAACSGSSRPGGSPANIAPSVSFGVRISIVCSDFTGKAAGAGAGSRITEANANQAYAAARLGGAVAMKSGIPAAHNTRPTHAMEVPAEMLDRVDISVDGGLGVVAAPQLLKHRESNA